MGGTKAKVPPAAEFGLLHPRDGNCLGDGTDAVPSNSPGRPIYLRMTMGKNFNGKPDNVKIEIRNGEGGGQKRSSDNYKNYAGLQLKKYARVAREPMELFISTPSMEQPETICFISPEYNSDFSGSTTCTNIYATRPRFDGQLPVSDSKGATTINTEQQSQSLFLWAKITGAPKKGAYYTNALAGSSIMEMMEDERVMKRGEKTQDNSVSSYKSEEALSRLGPRTMVWKGEKAAALFHISTDTILDMKISPGIDPCLMIALGAHMMNRLHVLDREAAK